MFDALTLGGLAAHRPLLAASVGIDILARYTMIVEQYEDRLIPLEDQYEV